MSLKVDIHDIDNHQLNDVEIGTVGAHVEMQKGPIIAVFHQYALFGKGTTIHSPGQFEYYQNDVNDKSVHVGGLQRINAYVRWVHNPVKHQERSGAHESSPYTDKEWETLPHVFMTNKLE